MVSASNPMQVATEPRSRRGFRLGPKHLLPLAPLVAFIVLWWSAGAWLGGIRGTILASPPTIVEAFVGLLTSPELWENLRVTVENFVTAFVLAFTVGLVGGILIGTFRRPTQIVEPFAFALYSIPKITLFPVLLALLGLTPKMLVIFSALHGVFPVFLATVNALKTLRPIHIEVARCLGASRAQVYRKVVLRAILVPTLAAAKICFTLCFLTLITAEIISGSSGMGHLVMVYYHAFKYPHMYAAICFTIMVCAMAYLFANLVERRLAVAFHQG